MLELNKEEQDLLQHVEVYGMNPHRAGQLLGIQTPHDLLKRPHVVAARESLRRTLQTKTKITKEDVIEGMRRAIDQGYDLGDPASQIRGWAEIGKLLNFYEPQRVDIRLSAQLKELRADIGQLPESELLRLVGEDANVIDADFYQVKGDDEPD